jgi:putative hemolysin
LTFISKLFAPVVWFLSVSTNGVLRLFGIDPNQEEEEVSEEDIRLMVDTGHQSGTIDTEEQEFIQNVFDFDDITVGEFATHRTDIDFLDIEDSAEQWEQIIFDTHHSFYPVCEGTSDHLLGILSVHDYFYLKDRSIENIRNNVLMQPYFVPETLSADVLFRKMKKDHSKIAVVLDEYGGLFGIVTINDLVEQLVGKLEESEEDEVVQCDPDTWEVSGLLPLKEAQEQFGIELPVEEYDTFGGFVFSLYGSIPDDGETFELETHSLHISVTKITDHRIEKATVHLIHEESQEEPEEKGLFRKNKEKSED